MKSALIVYASMSGNTEEVAELIEDVLYNEYGVYVLTDRIGAGITPSPREYDAIFFGSYTWDKGATPDEVKDFAADIGYKPDNVYVFGTGDTQFGGDVLFCMASDRLAKFYETKYDILKIEQSPRGSQERLVREWTKGAVAHWQNLHA